jgi:hypothetical protein
MGIFKRLICRSRSGKEVKDAGYLCKVRKVMIGKVCVVLGEVCDDFGGICDGFI